MKQSRGWAGRALGSLVLMGALVVGGVGPAATQPDGEGGAVAGKPEARPFTEALARKLLPEAASVNAGLMDAAMRFGYTAPPARNARLTMVAALWHHLVKPSIARENDLRVLGADPTRALLDTLLTSAQQSEAAATARRVSILAPEYLVRVTVRAGPDVASGRVWFAAKADSEGRAFDGQVDYTAELLPEGWAIVSFRFPETYLGVERQADTWRMVRGRTQRVRRPRATAPIPIARAEPVAVRPRRATPQPRQRAALDWLAAHQSPNGGWEAAGFGKWLHLKQVESPTTEGAGKSVYDPGVTGLALCAFLAAGYTNRGNTPYAKCVSRGLRYLKNIQDPEGCFGPRATQQYIYNHATAALAMVEVYGQTGSPIFKAPAQRALDFIALARNPYFGWRYGIKPGDNDTSVTVWMSMVIRSAKAINQDAIARGNPAPLVVDESALAGARNWLDKATDTKFGRVGYLTRGTGPARPQEQLDAFPANKSESMTAAGLLLRLVTGEDATRVVRLGADLCLKQLPDWTVGSGSIDMYYWFYGTLAMKEVGGGTLGHVARRDATRPCSRPAHRHRRRAGQGFVGSRGSLGSRWRTDL